MSFFPRSKALKNSLKSWEYSSAVDEKERLNVDLLDYARNDYRLVFWVDGLFWFRVCRMSPGKKGWILNLSFYGSWEECTLPAIVEAFEQTASYLRTSSEADEGHVTALWAPVGPRNE